jgi:hypothetical protein
VISADSRPPSFTPQLAYWWFHSEPDQPQPEIPLKVDIQVETKITLDGVVIYSEVQTGSVDVRTTNLNDAAPPAAGLAETAATNAAAAVGASAGWWAGVSAGNLVLGLVPVEASWGTYATAIGVAAVSPWVGLAVGAVGGAA